MISRRWFIILLCTAFLSTTAFAQDWPQWRGPNRDGNVSGAVIPTSWPRTLKEQWKVTVGIGHSSPVVSNGRIYVFARRHNERLLRKDWERRHPCLLVSQTTKLTRS